MKRPIVWITLFIMTGIYLRLGISEVVCLVSALFILFAVSCLVIKYKDVRYICLLLFAVLGFMMAGQSTERETAEKFLQGAVSGEGVVHGIGETAGGNQKLELRCDLWNEAGELEDVKLYAVWTEGSRFAAGDKVTFSGELIPFSQASVPGGYDEDLYLRTRGFEGKMYPDEMRYTVKDTSLFSVLARMRAGVHEVLDEILPPTESGIMKAMLTGNREDIPEDGYRLYTEAGVVHILCISGLHVSMLALYTALITEKLFGRSRRFAAAVTMLASLLFLVFIGFTPSAVRAVTMISVVMAGRILFRVHDRYNDMAIACLLILMAEPLYLFHVGFQLSFITVLGLCVASEKMEQKKKKERNISDRLKDSLRFSVYAFLFSFPLIAYHFYSVSLVGILANLVILPLSGILLGAGILSAILGAVSRPLGVFAAGSVYGILQLFEWSCTLLLKIPFSYVLTGRPSELVILLYYGMVLYWLKAGERKGSWKVAVVFCLALWCAVFENRLFRRETTIAFLDVGQGDAAVISCYDGNTYLIDGGGVYGREYGENAGKTVVLPYLQFQGEERIEAAFLSHPDSDHMIGILEILEEMPVKALYISDYPYKVTENIEFLKEIVEKYPIKLYTVSDKANTEKMWGFIYPLQGRVFADGNDNHGSMVLKYHDNGTDVLFTGDIEAADEKILLNSGKDLSADILKVSHHGSGSGTTEAFLEQTNAKAAIISCGRNNIYGHPHEETLERLKEAGTEVFRTDQEGTILLKLKKDGTFEIETMAERKPLYERIKETMEKW